MPSEGTQHEAGVVRVAKKVKKKATEAKFPTSCQLPLLLQLCDPRAHIEGMHDDEANAHQER